MMRDQKQSKHKAGKAITLQQVWLSLTDQQKTQFGQTLQALCQQLAKRQMREKEESNGGR